jgi:hypothetical protein
MMIIDLFPRRTPLALSMTVKVFVAPRLCWCTCSLFFKLFSKIAGRDLSGLLVVVVLSPVGDQSIMNHVVLYSRSQLINGMLRMD